MFGFTIFLVIIGVVALFVSRLESLADFGKYIRRGAFASFGIAVITLLIASTTIVPPRNIGIVVQFGKPIAAHSNGLHLKAPWADVEILDAAVQNNVYQGDQAIDVRLGNNSEATANVSIQWSLKSNDATELYLDYRTFDNIQSNLIDRNLRAALNDAVANYDPLNYVTAEGDDTSAMAKISESVLEDMRKRVGSQAEIRSVVLPKINYDKATQGRINELQSEIAKTRIAEQKKQTSEAEARANTALSNSLTNEVLTSKCLDIVSDTGGSPLGCFPGAGAMPTIPVQ